MGGTHKGPASMGKQSDFLVPEAYRQKPPKKGMKIIAWVVAIIVITVSIIIITAPFYE